MSNKCKECGCSCKKCNNHDVHLHVEIENLKQKLLERENHIVTMETNFLNEANRFPSGELVALREELLIWQDKYRRLYDAHRRVQRVNQGLEDKLLKLVDVCETDKNNLTKDVANLSEKLSESNYLVNKLKEDNERYRTDVSLAIQFLQCKQSNFVAHKFNSLPQEVQNQVSSFLNNKKKPEERRHYEPKSIKVPIPTFPPTAMVYSLTKSPKPERKLEMEQQQEPQIDIVSAAIMAKVLEERQKEKAFTKHCDSCTCLEKLNIIHENSQQSIGTQTDNYKSYICLRCNNNAVPLDGGVKIVGVDIDKSNNIKFQEQFHEQQIVKVLPNNFLIEIENDELKNNSENQQSAKFTNDLLNPKQSSINCESNNRNILLDNIHQNTVKPLLYTHTTTKKNKDTPKTHLLSKREPVECFQNDDNDQTVADWIKENIEQKPNNDENITDNNSDNARYAEMEENVKRFLFGESKLIRKDYAYGETS